MAEDNSFLRALRGEKPTPAVDWRARYVQLSEEMKGLRERLERTAKQQAEAEVSQLLESLLPVADNMERALKHAGGGDPQLSELRKGIELTYNTLLMVLTHYGVEPIEADGKPFDPALHEAVAAVPTHGTEPDTVISVEQVGYTRKGNVLRPARVVIAKESEPFS